MSTKEEEEEEEDKILQDEIDALSASITKQSSLIRTLKKKSSTSHDEIETEVMKLKELKSSHEELLKKKISSKDDDETFDRKAFDELILRKMFVIPSFEIHGGVKGLFDLGPPACGLKAEIINTWRKHFVLHESMLEMECTCLTPSPVLKTSGHVDRFTDLMVKDPITHECFRADKLLEDAIDTLLASDDAALKMTTEERENHARIQRQADAYTPSELDDLLLKYKCKSPSGQPYGKSFPFNLMFRTSIGPEGTSVGYLRPETAQGLFVNFRRLLDANNQKMPFAAAQIGLGFRNEIAPRAGLLRVREFTMAEIEHFLPPHSKDHPSFDSISSKVLTLFSRKDQLGSGKTQTLSIGDAVSSGLVNNQTLGYFMTRTQLFMERIGMNPKKLRFRQHLETEMAHYATDCWDLEIRSSYGWVECVGHADRACYDLKVHAGVTKTSMVATEKLDVAKEVDVAKLKLDRKVLGKVFRADQRVVSGILERKAESWEEFKEIAEGLEEHGKVDVDGYEITKEMVSWTKVKKKVHEIKYTPSVIEPSFGMGRILYSLLEHSFYQREQDEQRCVMRFNPQVAPIKCAVLPISSSPAMNAIVDQISSTLMSSSISTKVDTSGAALGRRYARVDEIGVPFAVTVDFQTLEDDSVTLRERDSCAQIRLKREEVTGLVFDFVHGRKGWEDVLDMYEVVRVDDGEGGGGGEEEKKKKVDGGKKTKVVSDARGTFSRPVENI